MFHFGGLGALFEGAKPPKAPRGDGTAPDHLSSEISSSTLATFKFIAKAR